MRYLTVDEVLVIYDGVMRGSGGGVGIRDLGALESAVAQPRMAFGGEDLYPSLSDKAAALGFLLIQNHPFVDGNKRTGHAATEVVLILNGHEIHAPEEEQYDVIMAVAAGQMKREVFAAWLGEHLQVRR